MQGKGRLEPKAGFWPGRRCRRFCCFIQANLGKPGDRSQIISKPADCYPGGWFRGAGFGGLLLNPC